MQKKWKNWKWINKNIYCHCYADVYVCIEVKTAKKGMNTNKRVKNNWLWSKYLPRRQAKKEQKQNAMAIIGGINLPYTNNISFAEEKRVNIYCREVE